MPARPAAQRQQADQAGHRQGDGQVEHLQGHARCHRRAHADPLEQQRLREKADFQVLGAVSQTISREESAIRAAAIDIGRAIVSLAVDRF